MQRIIITGTLGADAALKSTQGGDNVTEVRLAVRQGWGDREQTNWFRCNVWGKRASTVADHLRKGMRATVIGELSIGEYNGKPQFDVRVDDIDWAPVKRDGDGSRGAPMQRPASDDLDDDVPFISADPAWDMAR